MSDKRAEILYLSEEEMIEAGVMDMSRCIDTMEEMLKLMNVGNYMMSGASGNGHGAMVTFPDEPTFPEMPKNGIDRRLMAMPAYLGGKFDMAGCKWYVSNIENKKKGLPRSNHLVILNDKDTGIPKAIMAGNLISSYRTGAIPGVGARYFAPKHAKVCGIIGPGVMARTEIHAFCVECPELDTVKIKGRGQASIDSFVKFIKDELPQIKNIQIVDTIEEAVRDSDIVTVAVSTASSIEEYPLIKTEWIKKGAYLPMPSTVMFEDDFLINGCKKFIDNMAEAKEWDEQLPYPVYAVIPCLSSRFTDMVHEGKIKEDDFYEIGDFLTGKVPGRVSDDETIVFAVSGMPIEDVAWGTEVYRMAQEKGIGTKLTYWNEPKLW